MRVIVDARNPIVADALNAHWFVSLADAPEKLEDWRGITMRNAHMGRSAKKIAIMLLNQLAQPARHRGQAGKIYLDRSQRTRHLPSAIQRSVSAHKPENSISGGPKMVSLHG